ncbi:MAG: glutamine-hydrolyzing carbamoyl-phosphate synthase small subunit [Arcanobacterium sp.]|nr:glutamine-hydrolyzing carbamoyl-phosphate synthase small subunit [Arcanobacterium sp.]
MKTPAILVLADGSVFSGISIGAPGEAVGEVVFNTAITGYQEILTDPSYAGQLVTLTYPHIGNTGANREDVESGGIQAAGLIIRSLPVQHSSFRAEESLPAYLLTEGKVAIAEIDTRRLTRLLREKGSQAGAIVVGASGDDAAAVARAQQLALDFGSMSGKDLAREVSTRTAYVYDESTWELGTGYASPPRRMRTVVAYDFGVKRNILRMLTARGCEVHVVPATTSAIDALALKPDGIFLSNGPGDPEPCTYAIAAIQDFLKFGIPMFGICLGHQLLGLALGASTRKMPFGHHGANHPVRELATGRVMITSQNHGFDVDAATLPPTVRITHESLFDGSLQGMELTDKPVFSFQGHPEASPGPHDLHELFDKFVALMDSQKGGNHA